LYIWLTFSWSWDTQTAAANRKALRAFRSWRPTLMSSRFRVAAKLRRIHSVTHPVLEYDMEVCDPPKGCTPRKRKCGGSRPGPSLQISDNFLLSAYQLACSVRGLHRKAAWTRRACVSLAVLLDVFFRVFQRECVQPRSSPILCTSAAFQRPDAHDYLHFRAAAHALLPPDQTWHT
jgi:hypothetical protein